MNRRFTQEEVNLGSLVNQIHYYLPSLLSSSKVKSMMDQKQKWIADSINEVNSDSINEEKFDSEYYLLSVNGNDLIKNPTAKKR